MSLRVAVAGQKRLGASVLALVLERGHRAIAFPPEDPTDALRTAAEAAGVPTAPMWSFPDQVDLILAAHCHEFIPPYARNMARIGTFGYHPSLLPLHRGRDAIQWALRFRDRVTGGTVYWMDDGADTGPVAYQDLVFIRPEDTPLSLWIGQLFPMGLRLFGRLLDDVSAGRQIPSVPQDDALATWEPAIGRPPPLSAK